MPGILKYPLAVADELEPRARTGPGESVDIWLRGHRLHFPGGGREPTVTEEGQVPPEAGDLPDDVLLDIGDPVTTVSRDGWYVRLSPSGVTVNRTKARRPGGRLYRMSRGG